MRSEATGQSWGSEVLFGGMKMAAAMQSSAFSNHKVFTSK